MTVLMSSGYETHCISQSSAFFIWTLPPDIVEPPCSATVDDQNIGNEASPELREIYNDETGYHLKMFHLEKAKAVIIPVMGEGTVILDETGETGKSETFTGDFDEDRASKVLHNGLLEAERTLKDTQKMEHFFQRLEKKLKQVPVVGNKLADVPVMCSLLYNYVNKKYTEVPIGSIMAIISALTYFISPVDMIPDAVPGLGYMDAAAVITACLALVHSNLAEYQKWREENNIETTLEEELRVRLFVN